MNLPNHSNREPKGMRQIRAELLAELIDLEYGPIGDRSLTITETQALITRCIEQVEAMTSSAQQGTKELMCFFDPAINTMLLFVQMSTTGRIHVRYWTRRTTLCGVAGQEAPTTQEAPFSQLCLRCYYSVFEQIHRREQTQQQQEEAVNQHA